MVFWCAKIGDFIQKKTVGKKETIQNGRETKSSVVENGFAEKCYEQDALVN